MLIETGQTALYGSVLFGRRELLKKNCKKAVDFGNLGTRFENSFWSVNRRLSGAVNQEQSSKVFSYTGPGRFRIGCPRNEARDECEEEHEAAARGERRGRRPAGAPGGCGGGEDGPGVPADQRHRRGALRKRNRREEPRRNRLSV